MSSTVQSNAPTPEIQMSSTLKRTELGLSILHHRNFYLSLLVGALMVAGSIGGYRHWSQKKQTEAAQAVHLYEKNYLTAETAEAASEEEQAQAAEKNPTEKPMTMEGLDKFIELANQYKAQAVMIPLTLKLAGKVESTELAQKFLPVLESVYNIHQRSPIFGVYLGTTLAAFQEDLGKIDEALKTYEGLASAPDKALIEDKLYLDLGRLYRLKGDETKAQAQWDHLLKNFPNSEWARLAKLLMVKSK